MANMTMASLDAVLKELYKGQRVEELVFKDRKFLSLLRKDTEFSGKNMPLPLLYGDGGGASASFSIAQTNTTAASFARFLLTRANSYVIGAIDGEALEASASEKGSFVKGLKAMVDGKLRKSANRLARDIFRDGTGNTSLGTVAANIITFANTDDARHFEVGDYIRCTAASGEGRFTVDRAAPGAVTAVNRQLGNITSAAAVGAGLVTGDRVNIDGEGYNTASHKCVRGLMHWVGDVPADAATVSPWLGGVVRPTAPNTYGVDDTFGVADLTVDSERLGGLSLDASAYPTTKEAVMDAINMVHLAGGQCDTFVTHPTNYLNLLKDLESQITYDKLVAQGEKGKIAHISFDAVVFDGPHGPVNIVSDMFCPLGYGWACDMRTLALYSLGKAPKIFKADGLYIQRQYNADGYELRAGYRANLGCSGPGWNCCVTLP